MKAGQGRATRRQTLLFSATISEDIQKIASTALLPGYKFIDTVGDDADDQTHAHVSGRREPTLPCHLPC